MRDPDGGFYASTDADADGEEGAYYIWRRNEILKILGPDAGRRFCAAYGVAEEGNLEGGRNTLRRVLDPEEAAAKEGMTVLASEGELDASRRALLKARAQRTRPATDKKIVTAWNGMAIAAFALGGMVLDEETYVAAARKAADFLLEKHMSAGQLTHSSAAGVVGGPAFLDDCVFLADGLLALYEATFEARCLLEAERLARMALTDFRAGPGRPLRYSPDKDGASPPVQAVRILDDAAPSPNAVALDVGRRIGLIGADPVFDGPLEDLESALVKAAVRAPEGSLYALASASAELARRFVVVLAANDADPRATDLARAARRHLPAGSVLLFNGGEMTAAQRRLTGKTALFRGKRPLDGRPAAYVCAGRTCWPPVTDAAELVRVIRSGEHPKQKGKR